MTHDILDTVAATNDDYEKATTLPAGVDQEWWANIVWHQCAGSHFCKAVSHVSLQQPGMWFSHTTNQLQTQLNAHPYCIQTYYHCTPKKYPFI
ncbi:hypothetical protein E2C01_002695 [Portunus trituberculatus]|uniref:Uncharacterized protein n=1 Tax=Portunus trituberculatus TaxID=210409 RepID=A0A5B7CLX4_PORTR|nr:hypothetical protein [Portunus trituberculatus]